MLNQILLKSWIKRNYKNEEFKHQFTGRFWFIWPLLKELNPDVTQPINLISEDQKLHVTDGLMSFVNQIDDAAKINFCKHEIDFSRFSVTEPQWLREIAGDAKYLDLLDDLHYQVGKFDSKYNEIGTNLLNRFETTVRLHWGIQFNLSTLLQEYLSNLSDDPEIYEFFADPNSLVSSDVKQKLQQFGIDSKYYIRFAEEILAVVKIFYWKNSAGLKICDLGYYPDFVIQESRSSFDPKLYDRMILDLWDEKTVQFLFNEQILHVRDLSERAYIGSDKDFEPLKNENLLLAEQNGKNYLILVNHREDGIENLNRLEYQKENNYIVNYQYSKYLATKHYFPGLNLSGVCLVTNFNNSKIQTYFAEESDLNDLLLEKHWFWRSGIYKIILDQFAKQKIWRSEQEIDSLISKPSSVLQKWQTSEETVETPFQPTNNLVLWAEFYDHGEIKAPTDAQFQYKFLSNLNPTPSQLNGVMNFLKWNRTYGNCLKSDVELHDRAQTIRAYKAYITMQKLENSIQGDSRFRLELGHLLEPEILNHYRYKYANPEFQRKVQSDKRTYAWFNDQKWFFLDIDGYFGTSLNDPEQIIEIKSSGSTKYIGDVETYVKSYYLQICMYNKIFQPKKGIKMLLMLTTNLTRSQRNMPFPNGKPKIRTEYKIHEVNVHLKPEWQKNFDTALEYWELARQELMHDPEFVARYQEKMRGVLGDLGTTQGQLVKNFNDYLNDQNLPLHYEPDIKVGIEDYKPVDNPSNLDDEQYSKLKAIFEKEGD